MIGRIINDRINSEWQNEKWILNDRMNDEYKKKG